MVDLIQLSLSRDADRVLDLCRRAGDYVTLEYQRPPDTEIVTSLLTDAPPNVPPEHVFCLGYPGATGQLDALVTFLKGHYEPDEWYMGLLLLDPDVRRKGLGSKIAQHVIERARADGAVCIRVTPLDLNPRGRAFWKCQGFTLERSVTPEDGLLRHIHKITFERETP